MPNNKNDFLSTNKATLYGVLACAFMVALLIHWNQNYRKHDTVSTVQVIEESKTRTIAAVVKEYIGIYEATQNPSNKSFILKFLSEVKINTSYQDWPQEGMHPTLQAAVVKLSQAQIHLEATKKLAREQIVLMQQNQTIPEELKNKMSIELINAVKEANAAGKIIIEYKEKNP